MMVLLWWRTGRLMAVGASAMPHAQRRSARAGHSPHGGRARAARVFAPASERFHGRFRCSMRPAWRGGTIVDGQRRHGHVRRAQEDGTGIAPPFVVSDTLHEPWKLATGEELRLITLEELKELPDGTVLVDIFGQRAVVGRDEIDTDTRGGFVAYGRHQWSARAAAFPASA